jgi:serine O-acetyltransferase
MDHLRSIAILPLGWAVRASDQQELIAGDIAQWLTVIGAENGEGGLHRLLYAFPEFRALYYHRMAMGNARGALVARILRHLYKPTQGLDITTKEIGSGLFIAHGQATCISAERIGRNCYIHQNVTLGWDYRSSRGPILGDGVFIGTGAVVLGAVTIGDMARIGANAVVICDVPAGATAVGVPATVLDRTVDREDHDDEDGDHHRQHDDEQPSASDVQGGPARAAGGLAVEGLGELLVGEAEVLPQV